MENRDPITYLMEMGHSLEAVFLVGTPFFLLVLIILTYAVLYFFNARKFKSDLEAAMDLDEQQAELVEEVAEHLDKKPVEETAATPETQAAEPEPAPEPQKAPVPEAIQDIMSSDRTDWLGRLKNGLAKTRSSLTTSLSGIFSGKIKIDDNVLDQLHEVLYRADVGVQTTDKLVEHIRSTLGKEESADWDSVRHGLKSHALDLLGAPEKPLNKPEKSPWVILVVGVNGVGKTTTIGKLAARFLTEDKSILLAAADTFRAAAIDQLCVWGDRLGVEVIRHKEGSDPAAVAYDAVKAGLARKSDVIIIDTAGRLHNKQDLMQELEKINRVIGKDLPGAPHETWLVIDATTGQNAVMQVKAFSEVVKVTGLVVTKLDGTAKGGVVVGISDQFGLPIRYVGVGEKASDLRAFKANDYVESLF